MVPLKYLSNFWRTLEMPLINCEITVHLNGIKNALKSLVLKQIKNQNLK